MWTRHLAPSAAALLGLAALSPVAPARADDACALVTEWRGPRAQAVAVTSAADRVLVDTGDGVHLVFTDRRPPIAVPEAHRPEARWLGADTRFVALVTNPLEASFQPMSLDGQLGAAVPLLPFDPYRRVPGYAAGDGAAVAAWVEPARGRIEVRVLLADDRVVAHAIVEPNPVAVAVAAADGVAWLVWSRGTAAEVRATRIGLVDGQLLDPAPRDLGADGISLQPVGLSDAIRLYVTGRDQAVRTWRLGADGAVAAGPGLARAVGLRVTALADDRVVHLDPTRVADEFPLRGAATLTIDPGDGTLTQLAQLASYGLGLARIGDELAVVTLEEQAFDRTGASETRLHRFSAAGVAREPITVTHQDLALIDSEVCTSDDGVACSAGGASAGAPIARCAVVALRRRRRRQR
jgi:hypothetical protein